jgi:hypothetical protein
MHSLHQLSILFPFIRHRDDGLDFLLELILVSYRGSFPPPAEVPHCPTNESVPLRFACRHAPLRRAR